MKKTIDNVHKGTSKDLWERSLSYEWGRLSQMNKDGVRSTDTIDFIDKSDVPVDQTVTYASFILDYKLLKSD